MRNIKITYEYDGSKFYGFAKQNELRTIQGELEEALSSFLKEKTEIISAGRTDRGVHAYNQVSNFLTESAIPLESIKSAVNRRIPGDIHIKKIEETGEDFHARFSAKSREYVYKMKNKRDYNVFDRRYITFIDHDIDIDKFIEITEVLKGEHNFDGFRKSDCNSAVPVRVIKEIKMTQEEGCYNFFIKGDGFLKSMVRIIVGSALAVYSGKKEADYIIKKLEIPSKKENKIVAPPEGLYLYNVEY